MSIYPDTVAPILIADIDWERCMVWKWFSARGAEAGSDRVDEILDAMRALARPCALLRKGDGNSRLGGKPQGLPLVDWPKRNGAPLAFLCQLDLSQIRSANGPDWLPGDGSLLFFYDAEEQPWGFDPADRGSWAVIHLPSGQPPDATEATPGPGFPEKRLIAHSSQNLPQANSDRIGIDLQELSDREFDSLFDASDAQYGSLPAHQVGGYASPIQGDDMELEAQLVSNGIYCGDPEGYQGPRAEDLKSGAEDWVLLLQLDSDDDVDMMWGDGGRLYFWIREQDARRADFGNVWLVLQCF